MLVQVYRGESIGDSVEGLVKIEGNFSNHELLKIAFIIVNQRLPRDYNELINYTTILEPTHSVQEQTAKVLSELK